MVSQSAPDYWVFVPQQDRVVRKDSWQRKDLAAWCRKLGREDLLPYDAATDPRTEWEMQDTLGVGRIWDSGLVLWEYN